MTKEEIIRKFELRLKEIELELKDNKEIYEPGLEDLVVDFFKKRKITPQEEINQELKFLIENHSNSAVYSRFKYVYKKLLLKRDNPNWKEELKEEYKNNFKKFLILGVIPVFLLLYGFGTIINVILQERFFKGLYISDLPVYYTQLLMMHYIVPIYIYNPSFYAKNSVIYNMNNNINCDILLNEVLKRYVLGGNILFFSSMISIIIKYPDFDYTITWADFRLIIIPFCIGFVFFHNSFLKNKINE
jgi:hypothetical protein